MNVFLDTNVIIDLIQRRDGYEVVARILQEVALSISAAIFFSIVIVHAKVILF